MIPRASVIIPAHNSAAFLRETLTALGGEGGDFEVIVVDDGSTDETAETVRRLRLPGRLRVFQQENRGRAAARNRGAAEAEGAVLLFLDADVRPAAGIIAAHLRHYHDGREVGVQGRALQDPSTITTMLLRARHLLPDLSVRRREHLSPMHVTARNFSVAATAFHRVGGFDQGFTGYGWEDVELGARLARAGVPLCYEPGALVYHRDAGDLQDLLQKARETGEGAVYFWRKHGRSAGLGFLLEVSPPLLPIKWLVFRTRLISPLVERVRPWAERHDLVAVCSECYNHLFWQAYYDGVFAALKGSNQGRPTPT